MKRILFIVPHRLNRSPGQRFRFEQYLEKLEQSGYECEISNLISEQDDRIFYAKGHYFGKAWIVLKGIVKRWKDVRRAGRFELIFIYRDAIMLATTWFERQFAKSPAKVIYDFDDAIWLLDVSEGNRNIAFLKNPGKTGTILKSVDLVLAGNEYLKDYALQFNPNVKVVPTTIDMNYHQLKKPVRSNAKICIGWTGTETTIKHFLSLMPALDSIYTRYKDRIYFKLIAEKHIDIPLLDLKTTPWSLEDEIEQLSEIDIGLMPLPNNEWARGKCGFKGLQYMALGIPAVMSPVGVNSTIVEDGVNGFLAAHHDEWVEKLSLLIESEELRKRLGDKGKETVTQNYSVQSLAPSYVRIFDELSEQA